eukprot:11227021-Lingulodinium_polyedra.AAC.1
MHRIQNTTTLRSRRRVPPNVAGSLPVREGRPFCPTDVKPMQHWRTRACSRPRHHTVFSKTVLTGLVVINIQ